MNLWSQWKIVPLASWIALLAVHSAPAEGENELLPLPTWSDSEEPAPLLGGLLPQAPQVYQPGLPPLNPPGTEASPLDSGPPQLFPEGFEGLQAGDMGLFLPESLLAGSGEATPPLRAPTPSIAIENLPAAAFEAACRKPATSHLLDPLGLIPEMPSASLERFLEFHARDARVPIIVLIMDRHHQVPKGAALDRLAAGGPESGERAVIAYPIGEPWRARVFLSRSLHETATRSYLTGMASDCIEDALQASDPHDQVHRFCVRLSTRLFWLEDVMAPTASGKADAVALHEVEASEPGTPSIWAKALTQFGTRWSLPLVVAAACLPFLFWFGFRQMKTRRDTRERSTVWILPEPEINPRLGGAFSGGTSASASFRQPST